MTCYEIIAKMLGKKIKIKEDETLDEIRGVRVIQKKKGYRFSVDSVLLADFVALAGIKTAADLGTGSGIIAIFLAKRLKTLKVVGIELQDALYDLAVRNVRLSSLADRIEIIKEDIKALKKRFKQGSFDLIVSNPPYYQAEKGRIGPNTERTVARHEVAVTMKEIIDASEFLLKEGGRVALIYPKERINDIIAIMHSFGIGPKRIKEVHARDSNIVMVEGEKGYIGELEEDSQFSPSVSD